MTWNELLYPDLQDADAQRAAIERFHALYYHRGQQTWMNTYWLGVPTAKCPLDLWIYQEILAERRPDVIVEAGTYHGGSALFLACICELLGQGRVYSIDIAPQEPLPQHPRLEYLRGSSVSDEVWRELRARIGESERVLVILDSDHSRQHVLAELERFHELVSVGSYLILEDTNVNGHPVYPRFGPGPMEALDEFLQSHAELRVDREREKLLLTFNPRGYLEKVLPGADDAAVDPDAAEVFLPQRSAPPPAEVGFAALLRELAERDEVIAWLHQEVAVRDDMVALLHREVARRDGGISRLHGEVALRDRRAEELAAAVAESAARQRWAEERCRAAEERWAAIENSRLWRTVTLYWRWRARLRRRLRRAD
ncbi:MAG TPA: CmcI family methyltransferase [Thermoanaerobaculia bacterium]|jgi:cephalosporin hydroxylase|nr:CmcI family methyltransferase [Thermoanaerobaculia bacterium]